MRVPWYALVPSGYVSNSHRCHVGLIPASLTCAQTDTQEYVDTSWRVSPKTFFTQITHFDSQHNYYIHEWQRVKTVMQLNEWRGQFYLRLGQCECQEAAKSVWGRNADHIITTASK